MRTVEKKVFFASQHEQEEEWLNYMASKGKAMVCYKFPFFYEFEDCEPGEYIYRIEMLDNMPYSTEGRRYIEFLEDMGVEMVGTYIKWCYFRKKAKEGPFDLFSDLESRIKHYKKIFWFLFPVSVMVTILTAIYLISLITGHSHWWVSSFMLACCTVLVLHLEISLLRKIYKLKKEHLIRE